MTKYGYSLDFLRPQNHNIINFGRNVSNFVEKNLNVSQKTESIGGYGLQSPPKFWLKKPWLNLTWNPGGIEGPGHVAGAEYVVQPYPGPNHPRSLVLRGHDDHWDCHAGQNHDDDKNGDADPLPVLLAGVGRNKRLEKNCMTFIGGKTRLK